MEPMWKVVVVTGEEGPCEECGTVGDSDSDPCFAYTVGLHEWFGRPEVHCPGLSTDQDPASLGSETLGGIVNDIAAGVVARQLGPGSELEETVTNGHSRFWLRFTLGLPTRPSAVTALMAHPDATVIPVRWTVVKRECPCTPRAS